MDLKVSDFAHDSSKGVFTVVIAGKRLSSKNPFSLFSSALGFFDPKDRPKVAQSLAPVVEQWNLCLSPALIDAANHATNKDLSDEFYNTLSMVCPQEVEKYQTKYIQDQTRQYTQREVVTMLTKLECKDKVLLGQFGLQTDVNEETGALTEKGARQIMNMTKEERMEVHKVFTTTKIRNPCGESRSCMSVLDRVLENQTESVMNALEKARKYEKMQKITMIITITVIVLVLVAVGIVIGVFHHRSKKVVVEEQVVPTLATSPTSELASVSSEPVTEIELPPDTELKLSPLRLE